MRTTLSALLITAIFITACSPKTTAPSGSKMEALSIEGQILDKNTKINNLNIEIEKQRIEIVNLTKDIKNATDDAENAAKKASDATTDMKAKVGDIGKAATADIYAENAAKEARKVYKLNTKLVKLNDDTSDKKNQIIKLNSEIEKLKLVPTSATAN